MSLHYIYSNASNSTQDITAYCRLYRYSASTDAKEGSVAHSTLVVDDPDGTLDFVGHRRLYTYEDLAPALNQVVHNGFIYRQKVSRGPYRIGAGRIWTLDLVDTNVLLNRRLMNGQDASRPEESDVARMSALVGYGPLTPMTELNTIDDTLYFSTLAPVTMDAADYRTQPAGTGYIDDCRQASGKNGFVWYRESVGQYSLWYDFASSSNWQGTKRLSNVFADVDNSTTFAVDLEQEAVLDRDPSRVASGVMLPFDGVAVGSNTVSGTVYVQDPATTVTFAAIDWLAPSLNVKTKAKAIARANRYLVDASQQDDLITCSVKLPSANVNDFMAGMRFDAKFSHLPGYESFSPFRCLSRTVTEISEDTTRAYRLDLELTPLEPLVTPFAVLYRAQTADGGGVLGWACAGDNDGYAGCNSGSNPTVPTVGPLHRTISDVPGTSWPAHYRGFEFDGTGTVDIEFGTTAPPGSFPITAYGAATGYTLTVDLLLNGVVIGTTATGPTAGGSEHTMAPIILAGVEVEPGDLLTARMTSSPSSTFYIDFGELYITGGGLV